MSAGDKIARSYVRGNTSALSSEALEDGKVLFNTQTNELSFDVTANNVTTRRTLQANPSAITEAYIKSLFADDKVLTYPSYSDFPVTGAEGYIYVALDTGNVYKWEGGQYVEYEVDAYYPSLLGFGYGICYTATNTGAKTASIAGYHLVENGIVTIKFSYDLGFDTTTARTLNINNLGAKQIHFGDYGSTIAAFPIVAGDIVTFIYHDNVYEVIAINHPSSYYFLKETMTAGETSVTFAGDFSDKLIDIYTSVPGLNYLEIDDSVSGYLTITYDEQESNVNVYLKVETILKTVSY